MQNEATSVQNLKTQINPSCAAICQQCSGVHYDSYSITKHCTHAKSNFKWKKHFSGIRFSNKIEI